LVEAARRVQSEDGLVWAELALCIAAVYLFGTRLTRSADALAEKLGLGRSWVGLILLATVTSLPELATGVSAAASGLPNIALGEALGSCTFNLLILGILDLAYRGRPILKARVDSDASSAVFGILLMAIAGVFLLVRPLSLRFSFLWIGASTPLIFLAYFLAVRHSYGRESRRGGSQPAVLERPRYASLSKRRMYSELVLSSVIIIGCGIWLPSIGDSISKQTGLGNTFVGNLIIACTTSLPELVVSLEALRIRQVDLAIANLLGSNLFNLAVVGVEDIFFTEGPLLLRSSAANLIPAAASILMTLTVLGHMKFKPPRDSAGFLRKKSLGVGLLLLYLADVIAVHHFRGVP